MEARYEIREQIIQGGNDAVHRAYDTKMRREVAIKRILIRCDNPSKAEETTKKLLVEVGALASLQHPHIVTVFDVGLDEDGPYVVTELIEGKSLGEIVGEATLAWEDFRMVARQSLEALVAAHELNSIHGDLNPSNIILTWLPSGAFQVKMVDFGMATLIHNQSREDFEEKAGSREGALFVPPERFEWKSLDARSDLYSMGCCLYLALAGTCPFDGTTGMDVRQAHLKHAVTPLNAIRTDIPPWACDWVMGLISRLPEYRPNSAREALANFERCDKDANRAMGKLAGAAPKQPRNMIPGSVHPAPEGPGTASPGNATAHLPGSARFHRAAARGHAVSGQADSAAPGTTAKTKPSKDLPKPAIVGAAAAIIALTVWFGMKRHAATLEKRAYTGLLSMAVKKGVTQVPIDGGQLKAVFDSLLNSKPGQDLTSELAVLAKAIATDGTKIDAAIAEFATTAPLPDGLREVLFANVIGGREDVSVVPSLLNFSASTNDPDGAYAAIEAILHIIQEEHAEGLLGVIATTDHPKVRQTAESEMTQIINSSLKRTDLAGLVSSASKKADSPTGSQALDRLLLLCNPKPPAQVPTATPVQPAPTPARPAPTTSAVQRSAALSEELEKFGKAVDARDMAGWSAALAAMVKMPDQTTHDALISVLATKKVGLKTRTLQTLISINSDPKMLAKGDALSANWRAMISMADLPEYRLHVIEGLGKIRADWATVIMKELSQGEDAPALRAKEILKEGGR